MILFANKWPRTLSTLSDLVHGASITSLKEYIQEHLADDITGLKRSPNTPSEQTIDIRDGTTKVESVSVSIARLEWGAIVPPVYDLADVSMVVVQETDAAGVVGNIFLGLIVGVAVLFLVAIASSCPLIYADGVALDAEPLGGAICRGLQRTDLVRLDLLKPDAQDLHVSVRNQMKEIQYIDELAMLAVEHPVDKIAVHDILGNLYAISSPAPPILAEEAGRGSVLPSVRSADQQMWETDAADTARLYNGELRHQLTFTFERPKGSKRAGLVITAGTSGWGAHMIKQTLALHGDKVDEWYSSMTNDEDERKQFFTMTEREEQYLLKIYVRKGDTWERRGLLPGNGPLAFEQRVVWIDISDIEGDAIEFRMNPPKMYWSIDQIGVVYDQQKRLTPMPLQYISFISTATDTVRSSITHRDGVYLTLAGPADRIDATWARPRPTEGKTYSYFMRIGGYYEIDVPKSGSCRSELLKEFRSRPGSSTEYGLETFRKYTHVAYQ